MRLSTKHANQQIIELNQFVGGLNSTSTEETIADNQLAEAVNVEIDSLSGLLRCVAGTVTCFELGNEVEHDIVSAAYDRLNKTLLLFLKCGLVLGTTDMATYLPIGHLSGQESVFTALWEDGLLIASGGKLQYSAGLQMKTIETSPSICKGVYVRSGRVFTYDDEDTVRFSAVGDETNWEQDSNDASASVFVQVGYKAGGKIIGLVNMSSDMLILKDNNMAFRLVGDYPEWEIKEVSRNIQCKGPMAYCSVTNNVFVVGLSDIQTIQTTQDYGDMKASNIASNVAKEVARLDSTMKLRYLPSLNQIWGIGKDGFVLVYDATVNAFFTRRFNSEVVDALCIDDMVYVIKKNEVCRLDDLSFSDNKEPLSFRFRTKCNISHNDYLIKRVECGTTITSFANSSSWDNYLHVGNMRFDIPSDVYRLWNVHYNYHKIFRNGDSLMGKAYKPIYNSGRVGVYGEDADLFDNSTLLYPARSMYLLDRRIRYRDKALKVYCHGRGIRYTFNTIKLDIVEV